MGSEGLIEWGGFILVFGLVYIETGFLINYPGYCLCTCNCEV